MEQTPSGAGSKYSRLEVEQARSGTVLKSSKPERGKIDEKKARSGAGSKWSRL